MTDNSPVYWEVQRADNTWFSLHTYAWSVKSFGGRRFFAGAKRGEDVQLPHRRGRIWVPKTREAQLYDINMWVFPTNEDGSRDPDKTVEQKAHENWRKIIDAVDQEGLFRLRKRWFTDDSIKEDFHTDIESALAYAEFLDGNGPDADDGRGFYINLTFSLPDPYFYSNQIIDGFSATDKANAALTLTNDSNTSFTCAGDAITDHIYLHFASSGTSNPKVTFPDGNWVQLITPSGFSASDGVVVDFHRGIAVKSTLAGYLDGTPSSTTYVNGLIRRNPYFQNWPTLDPTKDPAQSVTLHTAASGTVKLVYDPAYR